MPKCKWSLPFIFSKKKNAQEQTIMLRGIRSWSAPRTDEEYKLSLWNVPEVTAIYKPEKS
jgi:hypothetical protein